MAVRVHRMLGPAWPDIEPYELNANFSQNTGDSPPADAPAWLENSTDTGTSLLVIESSDVALQTWVAHHLYWQWASFTATGKTVGIIAGSRGGASVSWTLKAESNGADTYKLTLNSTDSTTTTFAKGDTLRICVIQDRSGTTPFDTWLYVNGVLEATTTSANVVTNTGIYLYDGGGTYEGTRRWANIAVVSGSAEADVDETNYVEIAASNPDGDSGTHGDFFDGTVCTDPPSYAFWDDWASGSADGDTTINCAKNLADQRQASTMTAPTFRNTVIGVQPATMARLNVADKAISQYLILRANATDVFQQIVGISLDTYEGRSYCFNNVPGAGNWTDDLAELEVGIERDANATGMYFTALGAEVCAFGPSYQVPTVQAVII